MATWILGEGALPGICRMPFLDSEVPWGFVRVIVIHRQVNVNLVSASSSQHTSLNVKHIDVWHP